MTMESLSDYALIAGPGLGSSTQPLGLYSILQELQGLKRSVVAGFAAGASVGVTGLSVSRGDTLLSCIISGTTTILDVTGSASFSRTRIKVVDATTSSKKLDILWFSKAGA